MIQIDLTKKPQNLFNINISNKKTQKNTLELENPFCDVEVSLMVGL